MSDTRWRDVEREAASAAEHLTYAVEIYERDFDGSSRDAYIARMAFLHSMQSGHTSLESALVRIFEMLDEPRPEGKTWHRDLIARACRPVTGENARPAILSAELCGMADETRRFRSVAVRGYESFEKLRALKAISAARFIAEHFAAEITEFKRVIDPD